MACSKEPTKNIPKETRKRIIADAHGKCWLCGVNGTDVAHIIARKKPQKFERYKKLAFLDDIHSYQNLIFLCKTCHNAFDEDIPVWILLPKDLKSLLDAEEQFQKKRESAAAKGEELYRKPPSLGTWSRYVRYQIKTGSVREDVFQDESARWAGSPVATVAHSSAVIGIQRLSHQHYGIPDHVADTLHKLLRLYENLPPEVVGKPPVTISISDDEDGRSDHEDDHSSDKMEDGTSNNEDDRNGDDEEDGSSDHEGDCDSDGEDDCTRDDSSENSDALSYCTTKSRRVLTDLKEESRPSLGILVNKPPLSQGASGRSVKRKASSSMEKVEPVENTLDDWLNTPKKRRIVRSRQ